MKKILIGVVVLLVLAITSYIVAQYHMGYNTIIGTKYEKSLKNKEMEVFKSSKPYVENMVNTLNNYKMQYDLASAEDKKIIANNIKIEFANFNENNIENMYLRNFYRDIMGGF